MVNWVMVEEELFTMMDPNPAAMDPEERAPTWVKEELSTPDPKVVAERTLVSAIL
jgi:hypothetical protein